MKFENLERKETALLVQLERLESELDELATEKA